MKQRIFINRNGIYVLFLAIIGLLIFEYFVLRLYYSNTNDCSLSESVVAGDNKFLLSFYKHKIEYLKNEIEKTKRYKSCAQIDCDHAGLGDTYIRDFYRYNCKNMTRYGDERYKPMVRVDGAYFMCNDGKLKPIHSNCIVLSFGISFDDYFDLEVHRKLDCIVHSFDPFEEPSRVKLIRENNNIPDSIVSVKLSDKWTFHRIGITNMKRRKNVNHVGWLETYENIIKHLNLNEKIIDMVKIDTEGAEYQAIPDVMDNNPDLFCKYVKQLAMETHPWLHNHSHNFKVIQKLEKCFRLYRRDGRYYVSKDVLTEWQVDNSIIPITKMKIKNEVELVRFSFTYGELYFVNKNFL